MALDAYFYLVAAISLERIAELVVARKNLNWARRHGAIEYGASHYPLVVLLHTGFLLGCAVEALWVGRPFIPAIGIPMFCLVTAANALRWWCIVTLGRQWNTRIVIVPGLPLVHKGPYRYLKHPNYVAIVVEGIALPMVHTAWVTALVFTVLNAFMLRARLQVENAALATAPAPCSTC